MEPSPSGKTVIVGSADSTGVAGGTSAALGRMWRDWDMVYVSTTEGKVVAIQIE